MVDKYAVFSGALIKIAGEGHIEGAFVSAADYETLRARNAELEAEVAHLKKNRGRQDMLITELKDKLACILEVNDDNRKRP